MFKYPDGIIYNKKLVGDAIPTSWMTAQIRAGRVRCSWTPASNTMRSLAFNDPNWFYPWVTKVKNNGAVVTRGLTEPIQNILIPGEAALDCQMTINIALRFVATDRTSWVSRCRNAEPPRVAHR